MGSISNTDNIIDSRDVIERIAELQAERDADPEMFSDEDAEELAALQALDEAGSGWPNWKDGLTLILDSYFEDYARDLAADIGGDIFRDESWPACHIDWSAAADSLRTDYGSIDFDGETYWLR